MRRRTPTENDFGGELFGNWHYHLLKRVKVVSVVFPTLRPGDVNRTGQEKKRVVRHEGRLTPQNALGGPERTGEGGENRKIHTSQALDLFLWRNGFRRYRVGKTMRSHTGEWIYTRRWDPPRKRPECRYLESKGRISETSGYEPECGQKWSREAKTHHGEHP